MKKNHTLTVVIILVLSLRLLFIHEKGNFQVMSPDEDLNYAVAQNYNQGKGYTYQEKPTAFYNSFPLFIYAQLQQFEIEKKIWVRIIHYSSIIIFLISIVFFNKTLIFFELSSNIRNLALVIYGIYPSSIYYIGNIFGYEKIVSPFLVIAFYFIIQITLNGRNLKLGWLLLIPLMITLSCLLKSQLLLIYFGIFTFTGLFYLTKNIHTNKKTFYLFYLMTFSMVITSHIPVLLKNKELFGKHIISTQSGFELMQGHNDMAKGSWIGSWGVFNSPYYNYSRQVIPELDSMNENQESEARRKFALKWIKENPTKEIELILRKCAIFFLPKNFNSGYHPLNFLVHLAFIIAVILASYQILINNERSKLLESVIILSPVIFTLLLSIIFFVGFRWRYYAEPFFILYAAYIYNHFMQPLKTS